MLYPRCVLLAFVAAAALGGCKQAAWRWQSDSAEAHRGRFAGVGVYAPGSGWALQAAEPSKPTATARLEDDEAVIVTIDDQTGEVRACGDLSGYCVGTNPWAAPPARNPVRLTEHVSDLTAAAKAR
jgi:hypothetical protein